MRLRWVPSIDGKGGWFDIDTETLHRRGPEDAISKKVASRCRIHKRLLPWLLRWKAEDERKGVSYVVHYLGKPLKKFRRSWAAVAKAAGHGHKDGPHIMRHTAATWQMQAGTLSRGRWLSGHEPRDTMERVRSHTPRVPRESERGRRR